MKVFSQNTSTYGITSVPLRNSFGLTTSEAAKIIYLCDLPVRSLTAAMAREPSPFDLSTYMSKLWEDDWDNADDAVYDR